MTDSSRISWFVWRLLAMAAMLLALPTVGTTEGVAYKLPVRGGVSVASGLSLRVDTSWSDGYGYRPVRFIFSSPKPLASDQSITVRFYARTWRGSESSIVVEQDGDFPIGQSSVELLLATPHYEPWNLVWWDVWIDGVRDSQLSLSKSQSINHPVTQQPALNVLRLVGNRPATLSVRDRLSKLRDESWVNVRMGVAPEDWLLYTSFDAVVAETSQLLELQSERPKAFLALKRWLATGGTLWVEGLGREFQSLDGGGVKQLDELFSSEGYLEFTERIDTNVDDEGGDSDDADDDSGAVAGWRKPQLRLPRDDAAPIALEEALEGVDSPRRKKRGIRAWFVERQYGYGVIAGFPYAWNHVPPTPKAVESYSWHWRQRSWGQRHGLIPDAANGDFSNLLIPGVGIAPVNEFQFLITLFVLVVGPLNFWLLRRRQLTHLMALTVPLAAVVLTSALLVYALFSDGFGAQVRVRSLTFLDQRSGEQATWGRLSYYSGLAPADGLSFSRNCCLYPLLPGWNELGWAETKSPTREVEWSSTHQLLRSGWLRSRSPTQYLQVGAGACERRLEFATGDDRTLTVKNDLGQDIQWLLVRDAAGDFLSAEDVDKKGNAQLEREERKELVAQLRVLFLDNEPVVPLGLGEESESGLVEQQRRTMRRELRREANIDYSSVRASDNLLNQVFDRLIGLEGGEPLAIPPRSYIAFTENAVTAELGLSSVREVGSFHVILGTW